MGAGPDRRGVLIGMGAWAAVMALADHGLALSSAAAGDAGESFAVDHVRKLAEKLAAGSFEKPRVDLPPPFNALTAEQYRTIKFDPEKAVWRGEHLDYEVHLLPLGWIYETPVEIWIVDGGKAQSLKADTASFSFGRGIETPPEGAPFGFSGFCVSGTLNRADALDEFAIFQGASYFKAVGRGQRYGLSARGLAVNTARPGGEEFPVFRAFWIERPAPGAAELLIHALLDSESVTGAFRFALRPGRATTMEVEAVLFPRRALPHVGIAPLTSMYFLGPAQRRFLADYRPAVHNSEGLAVINGHGERLWRPFANPKMLQTSAFVDKDIKGFGFVQRDRAFASYEDLEARYERRPSAWIEPAGNWGEGFVELIEIPIAEEIHDNIVAYWKPATPLEPSKAYTYAYRMTWSEDVPAAWSGAWVAKTRVGAGRNADTLLFVVDFVGPSVSAGKMPTADLVASAGATENLKVQRHPELEGLRVRFELNTTGTELIELRLCLKQADQVISENWLYRWTRA